MPRHQVFYELYLADLHLFAFRFGKAAFDDLGIVGFENRFEIDGVEIAALFAKIPVLVENVGYAATHAGSKISSASSEDDDQASGHVFAAMVAYAFDDRGGSGVANRKALARDSVEKCFATGRTVESHV